MAVENQVMWLATLGFRSLVGLVVGLVVGESVSSAPATTATVAATTITAN